MSMKLFLIIWSGQAVSLLGSQLVQFALVWHMTENTGSATVLATASLVGLLPKAILGPIIGTLVDRWNRKKILIFSDTAIAGATVILAILFSIDQIQLWHIYVILFVRSLGSAFHSPAMTASTTLLVPEKHLSRVQGLNGMLGGGLGILAPALGAFLLSVMQVQGILGIDVGTALLAILPLLFVHIPQPETAKTANDLPTLFGSFMEGLRYLRSQPGLWMITLSHTVIYFLMIPAYTLLPILVIDHLAGGAPQLAALQSAVAAGIMVGGLLLSVWGGFKKRVITMLAGTVLSGMSWVLIGFGPDNNIFIIIFLFIGTAMNSIMVASVRALGQAIIPPELQGRIFSISLSLVNIVNPISLAIAGLFADSVGVQFWFLIGGTCTTILGMLPFFIPAIINIENARTGQNRVESSCSMDL
jgi:DHA3 family macrolide efflux protein-like MFS transporter